MSEKQNDGGPAFPRQSHTERWNEATQEFEQDPGMSLRDWFAGQALAGMQIWADYSKGHCNAAIVERAYIIADAMLKAREQQ